MISEPPLAPFRRRLLDLAKEVSEMRSVLHMLDWRLSKMESALHVQSRQSEGDDDATTQSQQPPIPGL